MYKVLITGASKGIGEATAEKFISKGYEVIKPNHSELDLLDEQSVQNFIDKYKDIKIDIIVNNAGINNINNIENVTDEDLKSMLQINLISPIKLLRAFTPSMKKNNFGRIINIGSIWAVVSREGRGIYSATKNGLHGITNTLALELAPYNILVNTICPGYVLTELTKKNNTIDQINNISDQIPLKRLANPKEIADFIYYLGSENNSYITGQKISIDGGYTIK